MAKTIFPYPCEIKIGDKVLTRDGREREIEKIDGRYIYFKDGSFFALKHPDIVGVVVAKKATKKKEAEDK